MSPVIYSEEKNYFKNANIYILEGFIVSRICSRNTCHSTNTYFNWK